MAAETCAKDFQPLSVIKIDPEEKISTLRSGSREYGGTGKPHREASEHQKHCPMPSFAASGWGQCSGWSQGGRGVPSSNFPNFQGAPISFLGGCIKLFRNLLFLL